MADQPWHDLPPEIAHVLRPLLPNIADDVIEAVRTVPAYSRPLEGPFGEGVRVGVEEAMHHFLAEIEAGGPVARDDVYVALGRGEMRAGRSLESLLSAYRVGARVAWRSFAAAGVQAGLEPDTLYLLAESIFAYIDVLSAESADGHALEQSAAASEAELRRRRLVRILVREPAPDATTIEAAASEAAWQLPRSLAVLAIAGERRAQATLHLPPDAIADAIGELSVAVVPDPDGPGRRAALERAVAEAGASAGLGTTVEPHEAGLSFSRARAALALGNDRGLDQGHGRGPAPGHEPLLVARDRAGEILLRSDPRLATEFARDKLAPLAQLPAGSRARLAETLEAWLAEQGRLVPVAKRLGIHPQTARYRLARLRELFGTALDEPEERFWLQLALRVTS